MPKSKNQEYWEKRALELEKIKNKKVKVKQEELRSINADIARRMKKQVNYWVSRFAKDNGFTFAAAKQKLTPEEIEEFRLDLQTYIKYASQLDNQMPEEWLLMVRNASTTYHLTRLEALKIALINEVNDFIHKESGNIFKFLEQLYMDMYYQQTYEIAKGLNIKVNLFHPNEYKVKLLIKKPWTKDGLEFSERLWGAHREKLVKELHTTLENSIKTGDNATKIANKLADKFQVRKDHAEALLHTESARIAEEARFDNYKDLGVEKYIIVATLDHKTSDICRRMDGKVFLLKDKKVGENYPPFHVRCRTTTAPHIPEEYNIGERAARDKNGKTIHVPKDMTYKDFHKKYIESDKEYSLVEKKWKNRHSDKRQHKKYLNSGVEVPKNFDKYQDLKYNDNKTYWRVKNQYRSFNAIDKKDWSPEFKDKCKDTIKKFAKEHDLDFNDHSVARYHDRISNKDKKTYMSEGDFVALAKSKPNYREPEGNLVVFKNKTAVIFDVEYNTHIKTVVVNRNKPRKGWEEI